MKNIFILLLSMLPLNVFQNGSYFVIVGNIMMGGGCFTYQGVGELAKKKSGMWKIEK